MMTLVSGTVKLDTGITKRLNSACSILMVVYVSEGYEKIIDRLLGFDIGIEAVYLV